MLLVQYVKTTIPNHPPVLDDTSLSITHNTLTVHQMTYTDQEDDHVVFTLMQQPKYGNHDQLQKLLDSVAFALMQYNFCI